MRVREGNKEIDIIAAAVAVFAETGYEATRMADIAERAGIATGTLYLYFKNKETLLEQIVSTLWSQIDSIVAESARSEGTIKSQIRSIVDGVLTIFEKQPEQANIFANQNSSLSSKGSKIVLARGAELISSAIDRKEIRASVDPLLYTHFFFGSIRSLVILWANEPEKQPLQKIKEHLYCFIAGGLESAERGIQ